MPTLDELTEIAKRNLAKEDAGISAVNATNRIFSRSPGVGAPGSTPETDQTNLNVAAAMEQGDAFNRGQVPDTTGQPPPDQGDGIDIAAVHARRNQILQGIDPDAPARYISDTPSVRGGPSRRAELQHELGTLTNIVHEHSLETAAQAHQDLIKQRSIDVSTQSANIFRGLKGIPMDGSPESAQKVQDLIHQNRNAFDVSPAVRKEVELHAKFHDSKAASSATPPVVDPATGLAWNGSRWVSPPIVHVDLASQKAAGKILATAGLTPEAFLNPKNVKAKDGDVYKDNGKEIEIETQGGLKATMPRADFDKVKGLLGAPKGKKEAAAPPESPTPTPATVKLESPDGKIKEVPADQAAHYIEQGAKPPSKIPGEDLWFWKSRGLRQRERLNPTGSNSPVSGFRAIEGNPEPLYGETA